MSSQCAVLGMPVVPTDYLQANWICVPSLKSSMSSSMIATELCSTRAAEILNLCAGPRFVLDSSHLCFLYLSHSDSRTLSYSTIRSTFVRLLFQAISALSYLERRNSLVRNRGCHPFRTCKSAIPLHPHLRSDRMRPSGGCRIRPPTAGIFLLLRRSYISTSN